MYSGIIWYWSVAWVNYAVQVMALQSRLHGANADGLLVANLGPGIALEFEPQGESVDINSKLKGIFRKQAGTFLLTDDTTQVTAELRGPGLGSKVGKRVDVTGQMEPGATAVAPATQVIDVNYITRSAAVAGVGVGAATTGTGIASAAGATAGGVTAAGTVTGLGITGSLPGQGDDSQQNSSR